MDHMGPCTQGLGLTAPPRRNIPMAIRFWFHGNHKTWAYPPNILLDFQLFALSAIDRMVGAKIIGWSPFF